MTIINNNIKFLLCVTLVKKKMTFELKKINLQKPASEFFVLNTIY